MSFVNFSLTKICKKRNMSQNIYFTFNDLFCKQTLRVTAAKEINIINFVIISLCYAWVAHLANIFCYL